MKNLDSSLDKKRSQLSVENQSFQTICVTAFPANPYFCPKPGKHDVTLTSSMAEVSDLASFSDVRMCQIDGLEGIENVAMIGT